MSRVEIEWLQFDALRRVVSLELPEDESAVAHDMDYAEVEPPSYLKPTD
jgi:hypothetical protein